MLLLFVCERAYLAQFKVFLNVLQVTSELQHICGRLISIAFYEMFHGELVIVYGQFEIFSNTFNR